MSEAPVLSAKTRYEKGDAARHALLRAGIKAFSDAGYEAVSTRGLAQTAGVKQPAINYYFGGKRQLYIACAEAVVDTYYVGAGSAGLHAREVLESGAGPERMRACLVEVMRALSELMFTTDDFWYCSAFIDRELKTPGPGHELIYERLWNPGVDLVARLIAAIKGVKPDEEESRVEAIFLLSSLLGFDSAKSVSRRLLNWREIGAAELGIVNKIVGRHIAMIGVTVPD